MKKLLFLTLLVLFGSVITKAQEVSFDQENAAKANAQSPRFKFLKGETFDFGTIRQGENVQHKFEFINTGKEALAIINVSPSCGCTIVDWPKKPVLPGKKAVINVTFNSKDQFGSISKEVYIQSNAVTQGDFYMLYIKGKVIR